MKDNFSVDGALWQISWIENNITVLGAQVGYSPFCVVYSHISVWLILCWDLLPLRPQPA